MLAALLVASPLLAQGVSLGLARPSALGKSDPVALG